MANLISQNSYVFILATGMLLCILTGGNIDLSVGSVVCFAGAVGATFAVNKGMSVGVSILIMLVTGSVPVMAGILDRLQTYPTIYRNTGWYADLPWSF